MFIDFNQKSRDPSSCSVTSSLLNVKKKDPDGLMSALYLSSNMACEQYSAICDQNWIFPTLYGLYSFLLDRMEFRHNDVAPVKLFIWVYQNGFLNRMIYFKCLEIKDVMFGLSWWVYYNATISLSLELRYQIIFFSFSSFLIWKTGRVNVPFSELAFSLTICSEIRQYYNSYFSYSMWTLLRPTFACTVRWKLIRFLIYSVLLLTWIKNTGCGIWSAVAFFFQIFMFEWTVVEKNHRRLFYLRVFEIQVCFSVRHQYFPLYIHFSFFFMSFYLELNTNTTFFLWDSLQCTWSKSAADDINFRHRSSSCPNSNRFR